MNTKNKDSTYYLALISIIFMVMELIIYIIWSQINIDSSAFNVFTQIITIIWSLTSPIMIFLVVNEFGIKNTTGRVWLYFGLGFLFWALGDIIWAYYAVFTDVSPFPSIADVLYLIGYPFLYIGMYLQISLAKAKLVQNEKIIIIAITAIVFIIAAIFVLGPIAIYPVDEEFSALQKFYSLFYPIGDLILLPGALLIIFKYKGGAFSKNWMVIAIGFFLYIVADLVYVRLEWDEISAAFMVFDHLYIASSMLFAIGATYLRNTLKK